MRRVRYWGGDESVNRVLRVIEQAGYSVHIRRESPVLDGGEPIPIDIYAVRSEPEVCCRIVSIARGRDQAELLAAVELAEQLGIAIEIETVMGGDSNV